MKTTTFKANVCVFVALVLNGSTFGQPSLYSIPTPYDSANDLLRLIDPTDGSTISTVTMTSADGNVGGGNGLATHPLTGDLYAVLQISGQGRTMVTLDPLSGVASTIGVLADKVAGIAFDASGTLYGVTGDGADTAEALYTVSTTDASMSFFMDLGNGADGETIGFNPDDGLMYHASGVLINEKVFESIDLTIPAVVNTVIIDHDPPEEILAFTYAADGLFFMADRVSGDGISGFFTIAPDGSTVFLGGMDHVSKGLALVGTQDAIPTVSQWGMIVMGLLLCTAGTIVLARHRPATATAYY